MTNVPNDTVASGERGVRPLRIEAGARVGACRQPGAGAGRASPALRPHGALVLSLQNPADAWLRHGGSYFDVLIIHEQRNRGWQVAYWLMPPHVICDEFYNAGLAGRTAAFRSGMSAEVAFRVLDRDGRMRTERLRAACRIVARRIRSLARAIPRRRAGTQRARRRRQLTSWRRLAFVGFKQLVAPDCVPLYIGPPAR